MALCRPVQWLAVCLYCACLCTACAYSQHLGMRQHLTSKESRDNLITQLEKEDAKNIDQAVHLLNLGMLYRLNGQYRKSIGIWETAKRIIAEQRATSISEGVSSFLVNNNEQSYSPNATEEQNLYILQAANFLDLNRPDDARVEVLQREQLLKEYPPYLLYPFADYFAGMVFEINHEPDQALISYRRAVNGYNRINAGPPTPLLQDYARLLQYLDEHEELNALLETWPITYPKHKPNLTILVAHGLVPEKIENRITRFSAEHNNSFTIALPDYPPSRAMAAMSINVNGAKHAISRVGNIDAMVRYELEQSMDSLLAQAIIRQIAKRGIADAVAEEAQEVDSSASSGQLVSILSEVLIIATERADLRSWNSLPAGIDIYRTHQPQGSYIVETPGVEQPLTVEIGNANQVLRMVHQIGA